MSPPEYLRGFLELDSLHICTPERRYSAIHFIADFNSFKRFFSSRARYHHLKQSMLYLNNDYSNITITYVPSFFASELIIYIFEVYRIIIRLL